MILDKEYKSYKLLLCNLLYPVVSSAGLSIRWGLYTHSGFYHHQNSFY
jgi:hypothetical protein